MSLNEVTVTWNEQDIGQAPLGGYVSFQLSALEADSADGIDIHPTPARAYFFTSATGSSDPLVANDNASLAPSGSYYTVTVAIKGQQPNTFTTLINFANGASQTLAFLIANQAVPAAQFSQYLPLPSGTPVAGDVPIVAVNGSTATAWGPNGSGGGGSGTVTSVSVVSANGLAGSVATATTTPAITLRTTVTGVLKGNGTAVSAATAGTDYLAPNGSGAALTGITAAQVGADASGLAAGVQTNLTAEVSRAEAAEALLAPKASPALTGTPTAPTATALTSTTQIATTAYTDSAVAVETSRAQTAEALKAPLASPALTGSPTAPTQTTGDSSTKIATDAFVATAVATETTRAQAAEALALPKAGGTMTGELSPSVTTLTFVGGGTTLVNAALGNVFSLTLTASTTTLGTPSSPVDGQPIRVRVIQGGAGSFTLAYSSGWDFGAAGAPTLSTAAGALDYLVGEWNAAKGKVCVSAALGF